MAAPTLMTREEIAGFAARARSNNGDGMLYILRENMTRLIATIDARDAEIAELRAALIEARAALDGGMNTVGLHHQIDSALKETRRRADIERGHHG